MDQKLSLVAWYDDLMRCCQTLIEGDLIEEKVKALLHKCEDQRIFCLIQRNELNEIKDQIEKVKKDNIRLETTLKNVRAAFECEVNLKEKLKYERNLLLKKFNIIKNSLLEDVKENNSEMKEKILSSLNVNKLQTVQEYTLTDDSLSDIEFDKTDDDLLNNQQLPSTENFISLASKNLNDKAKINQAENERRLSREFEEEIKLEREKNLFFRKRKKLTDNYSSPKKVQQDDRLKADMQDNLENSHVFEEEKKDQFDENKSYEKLNAYKQIDVDNSIVSRINSLSQELVKQRLSMPFSNDLKELNIDNRQHQFVIKKVFTHEKCGPCGQSIGFCISGYRCRDCKAVCHLNCKDQVPLPCIPYVSRANIGKQGKLVLISDYTPQNVRPCVPALIVHCCTEIEKRGLGEIGLYKVSGSKKEVNEYKERILNSKKGIPNLSKLDVYVLCGIVKEFLKSLDESLITKLAWRDFVTGSAIKDDEERASYLYDLLSNLHVANRDTLAYIFLHLKKIAASPDCKMSISSLAKAFGQIIVGFSMKDPPAEQMREENIKQIAVMEVLLQLDNQFWENLISLKSYVPLMRKNSLNGMIENLNRGASKLVSSNKYSNSRMSIGSRLCGGRIASGSLTPLKPSNLKVNPSKSSLIKPLF